MTPDIDIDSGAREILAACAEGRLIRTMRAAAPRRLQDAYAMQDRLFALHGETGAAGWFASATNRDMLRQLGLREPYAARWRPNRFLQAPALVAAPGNLPIALEAEVTFRLGRDLPPRAETYGAAEVAAAVDAVHPSLEIVISCFEDWITQPPLNLVAEGGTAQFLVYGAGRADWQDLDLAGLPVTLTVNGCLRAEGAGRNVLDGPLSVLVWLANHAAARGEGLRANQLCNTGMCAPVVAVQPGDRAIAAFGALGAVEVAVGTPQKSGRGGGQ